MSAPGERVRDGLAWAAAVLGIVLAAWAVRTTPEILRRLERKRTDLAQVRALAAERADLRRLQEAVSGATGTASAAWSADGLTARELSVRELAPGWILRTVEVQGDGVDLAAFDAAWAEAERAQPPWRVTAGSIEAVGPDRARVKLTAEHVERRAAAEAGP